MMNDDKPFLWRGTRSQISVAAGWRDYTKDVWLTSNPIHTMILTTLHCGWNHKRSPIFSFPTSSISCPQLRTSAGQQSNTKNNQKALLLSHATSTWTRLLSKSTYGANSVLLPTPPERLILQNEYFSLNACMAVTLRHSDGIREVPRSLTSNQALVPFMQVYLCVGKRLAGYN